MIDVLKNIIVYFLKAHVITIALLLIWIIIRKYTSIPENWDDKMIIAYDVFLFSILGFIFYLFDIESSSDFIKKTVKLQDTDSIHGLYEKYKNFSVSDEASILKDKPSKIVNMIESTYLKNNDKYTDSLNLVKIITDYAKSLGFMIILFIAIFGLFHGYVSSGPEIKSGVSFVLIAICVAGIINQLFHLRYSNKKNQIKQEGKETIYTGYHLADMLLYPFLFFRDFIYHIYCSFRDYFTNIFTRQGRKILFDKILYFIKNDNKNEKATRYALITIAICSSLIFFNFIYPPLSRFTSGIWGTYLLREPVFIEKQNVVGNLQMLYGKYLHKKRDYSYSLSSWIFIDQNNRSRNFKSKLDTTIIDFGSIPRLAYNAKDEMLRVFMKDETHRERTVYETTHFARQYWNHFLFNYEDGVMDIFINNKLVATVDYIIPFMSKDEIIIGSNDGLLGGIRDVVYTDNARNRNMIHLLYFKERWSTELHKLLHSYFLSS